jgi:hypothetical protein
VTCSFTFGHGETVGYSETPTSSYRGVLLGERAQRARWIPGWRPIDIPLRKAERMRGVFLREVSRRFSLDLSIRTSKTVATRYKSSGRVSDRFPFPRGEESQIILGRSPDSQAELMLPSSRLSAFPDPGPSGEWKVFPDYSGGTVPDLHRLPFYALEGTQGSC